MLRSERVKALALAQGFDAVGIAAVESSAAAVADDHSNAANTSAPSPLPTPSLIESLRTRLTNWLDAGYQATMHWIERAPERRADPRLVLPGCRTVIVVGLNYDSGAQPNEGPGMGRIARYAWGRDYHLTIGDRLAAVTAELTRLAPDAQHRWYADTGPVMEKAWAQQAGLGWIGKHSNLVSAEHGSWLLLGVVLTTLDLAPDQPGTDLCGTCTLCLSACPTQAMPVPYVVDAGRCLSYLTIEHRGDDIDPELARRIGNHLFGCDDCLDVCPYNTQAGIGTMLDEPPRDWALRPSLAELRGWSEQDFRDHTQQSPLRRARFAGFQRNLRLVQAATTPAASPPVDTGESPSPL